jgi:TolB protein
MHRLRLAAAALAATALACSSPDPCAFSEGGALWLALSSAESGGWQVQLVRSDGSCRHSLTSDAAANLHAAWGSSSLLAYDSDRAPGPGIWVRELPHGGEARLDVGDLTASSPAFSPDGATIAFEGRTAGALVGAVYTVAAAGGIPTLLTPEEVPHGNGGPVFSPDGASIYFVSNRAGPYDVYKVRATGGGALRVTTGSQIVGKPAVSPDGGTLAFARAAGSSTEVVLCDAVTGAIVSLGLANTSEPSFDPAGGRLAVRVFQDATSHIELVTLFDSSPVLLTPGDGTEASPAFAPAER